jgi:hypothetical protein
MVDREYVAQNGRTVKISPLGNLVAFQSAPGLEDINVKRSREGYVLSYRAGSGPQRIVFNVHDSASDAISPGSPDFVPESFTAPAAGSGIPSDTPLKATAVIRTRDGAIRLTQVFEWIAGYGPLTISMTFTALSNSTIYTVKREVDYDVAQTRLNDGVRTAGGATFSALACVPLSECPPRCPPGDPDCDPHWGMRAVSAYGVPAPSYTSIKPYSDNSEHYSAGLVTAGDLPGYRANEDNQIILGWTGAVALRTGEWIKLKAIHGNR